MFNNVLVFCICLMLSVASLSTKYNSNPYCGITFNICPYPDLPCPEGYTFDQQVAFICCNTYLDEMDSIYSAACVAYDVYLNDYNNALRTAKINEENCINNGLSIDKCRELKNASVTKALDKFNRLSKSLNSNVENDSNNALIAFYDCLLTCACKR